MSDRTKYVRGPAKVDNAPNLMSAEVRDQALAEMREAIERGKQAIKDREQKG